MHEIDKFFAILMLRYRDQEENREGPRKITARWNVQPSYAHVNLEIGGKIFLTRSLESSDDSCGVTSPLCANGPNAKMSPV